VSPNLPDETSEQLRINMELWATLATEPHRDRMLSRAEHAVGYLSDLSSDRRVAALLILSDFWKRNDAEFRHICEQVALRDPDRSVRGAALAALGACLRGSNDSHVGNFLANFVRNSSLPHPLRHFAYAALWELSGLPKTGRPQLDGYRIPEDVNWDFVDRYIQTPLPELERMSAGTAAHYLYGEDRIWPRLLDDSRKDVGESMELARSLATKRDCDRMVSNYEYAKACLSDPLRDRRLASLLISWQFYKRNDREFQDVCRQISLNDPDVRVRGAALFALGSCLAGTDDPRVGGFLAHTMRDSSLPDSVRHFAYAGLWRLRGLPESDRPRLERYRIPEDVDWDLVDSFIRVPLPEPQMPEGSDKRAAILRRRLPNPAEMAAWAKIAGEHRDVMLKSPAAAADYFFNNSWKLRLAALSISRSVWRRADSDYRDTCERMAFNDPHPQVRAVALLNFTCCFEGTKDTRVSELMATTVRDASLSDHFRETAYGGLLRVQGTPCQEQPSPGRFRFPDDVDWTFVEKISRGENKVDGGM
jgi:hypothetical protein